MSAPICARQLPPPQKEREGQSERVWKCEREFFSAIPMAASGSYAAIHRDTLARADDPELRRDKQHAKDRAHDEAMAALRITALVRSLVINVTALTPRSGENFARRKRLRQTTPRMIAWLRTMPRNRKDDRRRPNEFLRMDARRVISQLISGTRR